VVAVVVNLDQEDLVGVVELVVDRSHKHHTDMFLEKQEQQTLAVAAVVEEEDLTELLLLVVVLVL
jgi:hypothetical protein